MILVLTYHIIRAAGGLLTSDFYTISETQLEKQLAAVRRAGRTCLNPAALLDKGFSDRIFVLTFDDGTLDHFEVVAPVLEKADCRAVFFVPTSKIDRKGYLTHAQVRALSEQGHTIGVHSHDHRRLDQSTDSEIREQLKKSAGILQEITGRTTPFFAPPGGYINPRLHDVAVDLGFKVIRTMKWGYNKNLDLTALETIPINGNMGEDKFDKILQFREFGLMYAGKESLKAFLPMRTYELLRKLIFRIKS